MNNIIENMTNLVEKYTKYYKSDFYEHDLLTLSNPENKNKNYIWILRTSGTWLFEKELASSQYSYCLSNDSSVIAYYDVKMKNDTITKIKSPEKLKKFTIIYKNSNNVFLNRKISIDSWNINTCKKLASLWIPAGYDYFEII